MPKRGVKFQKNMIKKIIVILGFIIIIAAAAILYYFVKRKTSLTTKSPTTKKEYICPDTKKLDYEKESGTYVQWSNCMPHEGENEPCGANFEYEQWVNKSCGIKFKIKIAY